MSQFVVTFRFQCEYLVTLIDLIQIIYSNYLNLITPKKLASTHLEKFIFQEKMYSNIICRLQFMLSYRTHCRYLMLDRKHLTGCNFGLVMLCKILQTHSRYIYYKDRNFNNNMCHFLPHWYITQQTISVCFCSFLLSRREHILADPYKCPNLDQWFLHSPINAHILTNNH